MVCIGHYGHFCTQTKADIPTTEQTSMSQIFVIICFSLSHLNHTECITHASGSTRTRWTRTSAPCASTLRARPPPSGSPPPTTTTTREGGASSSSSTQTSRRSPRTTSASMKETGAPFSTFWHLNNLWNRMMLHAFPNFWTNNRLHLNPPGS